MNKEVKIGFVVVVALVILYWGISYLAGSNIFKKQFEYHAIYTSVDGLLVSNDVRYQGFKVGRVTNIKYLPEKNQWLVSFSITEESLKIKNDALAYISSADILGSMIIELIDVQKGDHFLTPNDTLTGVLRPDLQQQVDERLRPLVFKIEGLIGSVDSVIHTISLLLDKETRDHIKASFEKIPQAVQNILYATEITDSIVSNLQRSRIQDIIANFSVLSENLKNKSGAMGSIIDNLANITDSLKQANIKSTLLSINAVMLKTEKIMEKIERGEGSLGLLVNDEQLYNDLTHAVKDLDYLLMDVRSNPKRFVRFSVFGGGNKKNEIKRDTAEIKKLSDPLIQTLIRKEFKHKLDSIRKN